MDRRSAPTRHWFDDELDPLLRTWTSPLDLAKERNATLWSDDPILRALAREMGIASTSTQGVPQHLLDTGVITGIQRETCVRSLIQARIGDFPLDSQRRLARGRSPEVSRDRRRLARRRGR
jgi:hypothetical protein